MIRRAKTENGWVRGIEAADPRVTAFKGVPFAAPPVGENRWRAPQPCADWEGDLDCSRFAPIGMQDTPGIGEGLYNREWHVDPEIPMSEDSLYLNIWTNAKSADEKLPVLVWYFGGGLQWGYTAEMEFDGERIARRGVVVVSVNYRLGVFGFMAHPELTAAQPDAPTNFASLDQQAGLKWVKRNIAAFGGDPDNITIAGQSAGGGSVMSQMTCPHNFGLFKRAIVQSALISSPYGAGGFGRGLDLSMAEKNGENFLKFLGVDSIEEARKLDAFYIRNKYGEYAAAGNPRFYTSQDNKFCYGDPQTLFAEGKRADVQVMFGCTHDEFLSSLRASDEADFKAKAKEIFGDKADEFLAFEEANTTDGRGGYAIVNGIEIAAKKLMEIDKKDKENYYYMFDVPMPGWDNPGSFHSSELWFFFESLAKCWRPLTGKYYDLARQMCNYYCNFIKCGDPNGLDIDGTEMPKWGSYSEEAPNGMVFTPDGCVPTTENTKFVRFLIDHVKNK